MGWISKFEILFWVWYRQLQGWTWSGDDRFGYSLIPPIDNPASQWCALWLPVPFEVKMNYPHWIARGGLKGVQPIERKG